MASRGSRPASGRLFGLIFLGMGIAFFGCGLAVGTGLCRTLLEAARARHWTEVPARIEHVALESRSGDDSVTHQVQCAYRYTFDGREYRGTRVGVSGGSDNIGSWQQDTFQRLQDARDRDAPVPCFVDPLEPQQSLLVRDLRFSLVAFNTLFVSIFGSIGIGTLALGAYTFLAPRRTRDRTDGTPDSPWLQDDTWADGVVHTRLGGKLRIGWIITGWWLASIAPVTAMVPGELVLRGNPYAAIPLLFPAAGAVLLAWTIRTTLLSRKFGRSRLELATFPGRIGGELRGTFVASGRIESLNEVDLHLKCVHTVTNARGSESRTTRHTIWEDRRSVWDLAPPFGQTELRVPFAFRIPASGCHPTGHTDRVDHVDWTLAAHSSIPGVDLDLAFPVPVYASGPGDTPAEPLPSAVAEVEPPAVLSDESPDPARIGCDEPEPGVRRFVVRCWPGPGLFAITAIVWTAMFAASLFMTRLLLAGDWFILVFLAVFWPMTLLLMLVLPTLFGSFTLHAGPDALRIRRSWGPIAYERRIEARDVDSIDSRETASAGDSHWYTVRAHLRSGRHQNLVSMVKGPIAARWFVRQIESRLTLPAKAGTMESSPVAGA